MKYSKDTGVPIGVSVVGGVILRSMEHNIGMGARINRILATAHVVCCKVHPENLVLVDTIANEANGVPISGDKTHRWCPTSDASQDMVLELRNKVLTLYFSERIHHNMINDVPLVQHRLGEMLHTLSHQHSDGRCRTCGGEQMVMSTEEDRM